MTLRLFKIILKDRKLIAASIFLIAGIIFLSHYLFKDKIITKSDLVEINDKLRDYSFYDNRTYRNHIQSYYLFLDSYDNKFQIIADLVDCFKINSFKKNVNVGDSLKIFVSKKDFINLKNNKKIKVFGIYKNSSTYLECNNAINNYNSKLTLFGGLAFIFTGLIIFYTNRNKLKTNRI